MSPLAYEHNGARISPERFYAIACDPRRHVAVEACAGAGKTWMLVSRILRALLAGTQPHEILAITFTKKAAGEMRQRLQEWLAGFAVATPEVLRQALQQRGIEHVDAEQCEALKQLYPSLLATGRPVQIRTFHSWFAALLRSAPLSVLQELALPTNYDLLEDDSEAIALVWRRFYSAVAADTAARHDFEASVAVHGRSNTQKALEAALAKRVEFALADQHGVVETSIRTAADLFPEVAGFAQPQDALEGASVRERWLARARTLGTEKNKTPQKAAQGVIDAFETPDLLVRLALLRKAFFVKDEDRLSLNLAKFAAAQEAEPELQALCAACGQHQAWLHHQRMTRLSRLLLAQYAALKHERGWIDMNDVERAAQVMLADSVLSGWVQERLDMNVRHLLIDEFQDTNPLQWQALHAWLSGYTGAGRDGPSVFLVGDPKQSIYRFRRAEPQVFRAAQEFITQGLGGDRLSCDHTHRNAPEIMAAVNEVMAQAQAAAEYDGFRLHSTQSAEPGRIGRLPQIERIRKAAAPQTDDELSWRDSLTVPRELPEERLVSLECRQAAAWVAEQLAAGAQPGDVMVLARRRDRLAVMEDELRALRIPAQQPEKTQLGEAPEVQDLIALLDVLVSPTHDLSLARVLKSPLFNASDDSLVQVALLARQAQSDGRPQSWLELLQTHEAVPTPLRDVGRTLRRWKVRLDTLPPHDALDTIFDEADVLARYAQAAPAPLRPGVLANLRALLGAALEVNAARYATPYALVRALKAGGVRGPALAARGAVRLLTVHGAKGLEAPIVLMLDTDGPPSRSETMGVVIEWPGEEQAPVRFAFIASESRPPACSVDALAVEQAARQREELNALYVAMTRARRQLVLSSVQPHVVAERSWWRRLETLCDPLHAPEAAAPALQASASAITLLVVPRGGPGAAPAVLATDSESSPAARFGQAVHRLLERRPRAAQAWPQEALPAVAREFGLSPPQAAETAAMALRMVQGEGAWAWDFEAIDWQGNEVELHHEGELLRLDRLVRRRATGEWWVLDYKSLARPEKDEALLQQMRRYRQAVALAHGGAAVQAAFLTGQGRLVVVE